MAQITYTDKIQSVENPSPEVNKWTAENANEVKSSVNALYTNDYARNQEFGVIVYADTVNTSSNKQTLTASQDNNLTIVDADPDRTQAPLILDEDELWVANKITPYASGDSYIIRLDFSAEIANADGYFDLKLDINGSIGDILTRTQRFPKGANIEQKFSSTNYIFCRNTFFTNGGNLQINPSHTMLIWNKVVTIHRIYAGR